MSIEQPTWAESTEFPWLLPARIAPDQIPQIRAYAAEHSSPAPEDGDCCEFGAQYRRQVAGLRHELHVSNLRYDELVAAIASVSL